MPDQVKEQDYKNRIKELEDMVDDKAKENCELRSKLYTIESKCSQLEIEKNKLLNIIDKLAEGIANK